MKQIAMVPCRGGSKGIPLKNIHPFNGKPLLYWNIKALLEYGEAEVFLNTDSREIKDEAYKLFGKDISYFIGCRHSDYSTTIEIVQEFIEKQNLANDDVFMLSQVTAPYLTADDVRRAMYVLGKDQDDFVVLAGKFGSVQTVGKTYKFYYDKQGVCINYKGRHKRRQDWEGTLQRNGCLYVTTVGMIRETASFYGGNLGQILQPYAFDIDEYADVVYGEVKMSNITPAVIMYREDDKDGLG